MAALLDTALDADLDRHEARIDRDIAQDEQVAAKAIPAPDMTAQFSDDPDEVQAALDVAEEDFNLAHIKLLRARLFELQDAVERDGEDDPPRGLRAMYYAIKI